jgi:hypothetical protein
MEDDEVRVSVLCCAVESLLRRCICWFIYLNLSRTLRETSPNFQSLVLVNSVSWASNWFRTLDTMAVQDQQRD